MKICRFSAALFSFLIGIFMPSLSFAKPFTLQSTLGDLLTEPAFQGFADRMLPRGDEHYDRLLPLEKVSTLMPYHSHIRPAEIIASLNYMQRRVEQGETVFYDIYSEQEKRADATKNHTGLFVFKGRRNAPFAMVSAGGGFTYVGSLHEGFPIAQAISEQGYHAFVVKYRVGLGAKAATEDMAKAVEFVLKNAEMFGVDPKGYSIWGGSASARIAANIGSYGTQAFGADIDSRPSTVVMLYTGHTDYSEREPATFVAVGEQDGIASPRVMKQRVERLKQQGVATEFHLYPRLGHGFALGAGTSAEGWEKLAVQFWQKNRR